MKLGALKSAIREFAGAPRIYVQVGGVVQIMPAFMKGSMLEELDRAFPGGRAVETGLWLREDGFLAKEPRPADQDLFT